MKKFLTCILTFLCTFNLFAQKDYYAEIQFLISSDSIIQNKEWFDYLEVVEALNDSEIESVIVVSSTSPDGSEEFNKYLADKRAQKVVSTLSNISKRALPEIETAISSYMMKKKEEIACNRKKDN